MANNQDKGANQGNASAGAGNNTAGTGQQGGQGSGGGMPNHPQQGQNQPGQKPEDKMNKDWGRDTGSKGGRQEDSMTDKENPADKDRMGQQSQRDNPQGEQDR
ncbi:MULTISPECIES: hypothetical protein [Pseudomonas]|jgi:hypothetical protein|uniref:Uncharacterized protein n=1 Tax=Pseudomonas putida TaxID=303 RepID=A0A1L7NBU6_PSEPU|nr:MULTISPECIES: hypothetical protein [Pseudomonas]PYG96470.1 hypothetical protein CVV67_33210 [Arthrobacter stackebrandtii]MBP2083757.1 hypothetical protein [Pseudomonas sp. PvP089]MBP2090540.1 hypothetical protein [Pseudomonas sp. PvP088]MBP2223296.1 hypothetical protein [Pseudomonas putida]MCE0777812.1 hypothetical protein [Pseudomonas sp. NMI542_15]